MSTSSTVAGVVRHLAAAAADDADLLARYSAAGDQAAFAAVVQRYGGLVLGVARRQLADRDRADDVFQATFLALARAAGRLTRRTPLANWLYTVALRQARKARTRAGRRDRLERAAAVGVSSADPLAEISGRELLRVIDDELARLPERYRLPVLLCCVQGLSREEAAARLGWTDGAVKGRLERGRRRLAERLTARGLAPAVALTPLVPAELLARAVGLGGSPWGKAVPGPVAALAAEGPRHLLTPVLAASALLAVGLAGWSMTPAGTGPMTPTAAADPAADVPGDPLPAGAVARFGTDRYRHGVSISGLGVSADGRRAVATSGNSMYGTVAGYDLSDGRRLYTVGRTFPYAEAVGLSPDGKTAAVKLGQVIRLFDPDTGSERRSIKLGENTGGTWTEWMTFSPDGRHLAFTLGDGKAVTLLDVGRGEVVRTLQHAHVVFAAAFSPDGSRLAAGGYDQDDRGNYFGRLWDVATGEERGRFPSAGTGIRSLAFSPDGKSLAVGGDEGSARVYAVDGLKERYTLPRGGYRVRSVAFSPDGQTLAVAGDELRVADAATGAVRRTIDRKVSHLHFTADGRVLVGAVAGRIARWDTNLWLPAELLDGGDSPVEQVVPYFGGRLLLTRGQAGDAHLWDGRSGEHLKRFPVRWQHGLAVSPDGRRAVWAAEEPSVKYKDAVQPNWTHTGSRLKARDLETGLTTDLGTGFEGDAFFIGFSADGTVLVGADRRDGTVRVFDPQSGALRRSFRAVPEDRKGGAYQLWRAELSPDGRTLAVSYQSNRRGGFGLGPIDVKLWDVESGQPRHELVGHTYYVEAIAFSPDGRLVVTGSGSESDFTGRGYGPANQLNVWEVATGRKVRELGVGAVAVAFSPDGRTLAAADPHGLIQLWETGSWKVRAEFKGHRDRVSALAFGPDGRLFSGSDDTTALAWEVRPKPHTNGPLADVWKALAGADAKAAFIAQGRLLGSPAEAVRLLGEKLTPATAPDVSVLDRLIAELGSDDFVTRERAEKELTAIGRAAAGRLRAVKADSPEARRRAAALLSKFDAADPLPDEVRAGRAVEALERIGSAEAKGLLTKLAGGDPGAVLTREATTAVKRTK